MSKKKILVTIVISVLSVLLLATVVVANTDNVVKNWMVNKVISQNENGLVISSKNQNDNSVSDAQKMDNIIDQNTDISDPEKAFNGSLIEKYKMALTDENIYLYEIFMNDNKLHEYRFIRKFTNLELDGAAFSEDFSRIIIQGESYVIKWGYPGQLPADEGNLPELDESTLILRVFTEDNFEEGNQIFAKEVYESIKKDVIIPIMEGRVAIFDNENDTFVRNLTDAEISSAKISDNGVFVNIMGEIFIVTYQFNDNFTEVLEIRLRPQEGYKGDAGLQNPEDYQYFSIAQWIED